MEESKKNFSLSCANNDAPTYVLCVHCEGSSLHGVIDPNSTSLCMSCTRRASCDKIIAVRSCQKVWVISHVPLNSYSGDASFNFPLIPTKYLHKLPRITMKLVRLSTRILLATECYSTMTLRHNVV